MSFVSSLFLLAGAAIGALLVFVERHLTPNIKPDWPGLMFSAVVGAAAGGILRFRLLRRQQAKKALQASEARYRDLFENANDLIQIVSPEGKFLFVNRAWRRALGYAEEEIGGLSVFDVIYPEDCDHCRQAFAEVLLGSSFNHLETRFVTKDGRVIEVEGSVNCNFEEGRPINSRGIFRDLSERRRAEAAQRASEERYRRLVENIDLGICLVDSSYRVQMANPAMARIFGRPAPEVIGHLCRAAKNVPSSAGCPGTLAMEQKRTASIETELACEDGRSLALRLRAIPILDGEGEPSGFIEVVEDISDQRRTEEALNRSHAFSHTVLNSMKDAVAIIDVRDFTLAGVNASFRKTFGEGSADAGTNTCHYLICGLREPCPKQEDLCPVRQTLATGKPALAEQTYRREDGTECNMEVSTAAVCDKDGQVSQVIHVSRDITRRRRAEQAVQKLAYYDTLTGLPNRALLADRLAQGVAKASRDGVHLAILFLDLDRFKELNDTLGHASGDQLLQVVAERFRSCVRSSDTVARLGGDEFVIVLGGVRDQQTVAFCARKLLESLAAPVFIDEHEVFTAASIGIAIAPDDGEDVVTLLKHADTAMYHAKATGGNSYRFYSQEMNQRAMERLYLETGLRRALRENELALHYQPQFDLKNNRLLGVEALVRWRHPECGLLLPSAFIPLAEETGLILRLGEWVLRTACTQARRWQDEGMGEFQMAVNLSVRQFRQSDFASLVAQILDETGLDPHRLELELTESTLMDNAEHTREQLVALSSRGIRLAIDDFGTGYSSLSYLKHFPVDRIKIAQEFVGDLQQDADDAAIVVAIIALANSLGIRVIAEGVETREQLDFLHEHNCCEAQGFFLGHPMEAQQLRPYLQQQVASLREQPYLCGESA